MQPQMQYQIGFTLRLSWPPSVYLTLETGSLGSQVRTSLTTPETTCRPPLRLISDCSCTTSDSKSSPSSAENRFQTWMRTTSESMRNSFKRGASAKLLSLAVVADHMLQAL